MNKPDRFVTAGAQVRLMLVADAEIVGDHGFLCLNGRVFDPTGRGVSYIVIMQRLYFVYVRNMRNSLSYCTHKL